MNENASSQPGIFGKLPTRGDFVTRSLPVSFVEPWDLWLQHAISDSRDQLDEDWLDIYLTSPIWRFVLSPSVVDQSAWAGMLMPSVDRVGRYFPLTLAVPLRPNDTAFRAMTDENDWFNAAEALLLSCLETEFDMEGFDERLARLGVPSSVSAEDGGSPLPTTIDKPVAAALRIATPSNAKLDAAFPSLLSHAFSELYFAYSLWWTGGSERISPSLLVCQGLPPVQGYCAMLAGDWTQRGWQES
jgi:type VI secretion system protein ImpM